MSLKDNLIFKKKRSNDAGVYTVGGGEGSGSEAPVWELQFMLQVGDMTPMASSFFGTCSNIAVALHMSTRIFTVELHTCS